MSTVKLPGERGYDTHMVMQTGTHTYDVSLTREFKKHLSNAACKHGVISQEKYKKWQVNGSGKKDNIMFRSMLMFHTNMLRCFVIQTNFHHCHFVVHTQNYMVSEG